MKSSFRIRRGWLAFALVKNSLSAASRWGGGLLAAALLSSCCCVHPPAPTPAYKIPAKKDILEADFAPPFSFEGYQVYQPTKNATNKHAPAVLILHEVNGLSPACLELAKRLSNEGYAVYVPLLFGKIADETEGYWPTTKYVLQLLTNPQWDLLSGHKAQGINEMLRRLIREKIAVDHKGEPIGVVGLCLTGAFPLALMSEPQVKAIVVAEPSLPLATFTREAKWSLGISDKELAYAVARSAKENIPILGFRFEADPYAPRERFWTLSCLFRERFINREIPNSDCERIPRPLHPVLTGCYVPKSVNPHSTYQAYCQLVDYLNKRLKQNTPQTSYVSLSPAQRGY